MVNYRKFKIMEIVDFGTFPLEFYVEGIEEGFKEVIFSNNNKKNFILCIKSKTLPFYTYKKGDIIEIDLDKTKLNEQGEIIRSVEVVKKYEKEIIKSKL